MNIDEAFEKWLEKHNFKNEDELQQYLIIDGWCSSDVKDTFKAGAESQSEVILKDTQDILERVLFEYLDGESNRPCRIVEISGELIKRIRTKHGLDV